MDSRWLIVSALWAHDPAAPLATCHPHVDPVEVRGLAMRMRSLLADEYMFFRGSADEFARWCTAHCSDWLADQDTWVLLHGDVHIGNVGTSWTKGDADEPGVGFGLVDLDEAVEGPFQIDLLRALTSIRFAARADNAPLAETMVRHAAGALLEAYTASLSGQTTDGALRAQKQVGAILKKSANNDPAEYVARYARLDGSPRFRPGRIKNGQLKDILEPVEAETRAAVANALFRYITDGCEADTRARFRIQTSDQVQNAILDVARWTRVASSGSQGVYKYLVLLDSPLKNDERDWILELKEEPVPAAVRGGLLARYATPRGAAVARAHRRFFAHPEQLLGHASIDSRSFLVSLKDPYAEELEAGDFKLKAGPQGAVEMARLLGAVVGLAHRHDLLSSKPDSVDVIVSQAQGLADELLARSSAVEAHLRAIYASLRDDPAAREYVQQADEFVRKSLAAASQ